MDYQGMTREELIDELKGMEIGIRTLKASTERYLRIEKALRESEERYRSLVKQCAAAIAKVVLAH